MVFFSYYSFGNKIYHNNFINNLGQFRRQAYFLNSESTFYEDYPSGGNYWSDYQGVDLYSGPNQDQPGSDGIGDTPYSIHGEFCFIDCHGLTLSDNYPFMRENGWEVAKPDFWIDEIKPVQVVWKPDINGDGRIDLVAGKSTMVRVEVGMKDYEALDKQELVEVRLDFDGADYVKSKTIEQLEQNNQIDFYPVSPATIGEWTIIAKVDPENTIEKADETNNEKTIEITVKETKRLYVGYTKIDSTGPANYGTPSFEEFQATVNASGEFIKAIYPVSQSEFKNEINSKYPEYKGDPTHYLGMIEDILSLAVIKIRSGIDRAVGIVSDHYFTYHGLCGVCGCTKGVTHEWVPWSVLTEVGYLTAPAHEIGHTYGLHRDKEEYVFDSTLCKMLYHGNPASGFWVDRKELIENSICFMGSASQKDHFDRWVCDGCYKDLFQQFRINKDDPEILLLSGIIFKDGRIELRKSYYLPSEELEYPISGDYSIQLIDQTGLTIQEISFGGPFEILIEPFGVVETDFAPFVLTIPYTKNIWEIQIQYKEEMLIKINPNTKLLHDGVDSIPDHGFINNPEQCRNALHNKIEAVEKMIEQDNLKGAVNKLKFDIKDKFEKWLVDGYEVENSLQLSKEEVIELVDEIIERFNLMLRD